MCLEATERLHVCVDGGIGELVEDAGHALQEDDHGMVGDRKGVQGGHDVHQPIQVGFDVIVAARAN